jgi:hypothetical protein
VAVHGKAALLVGSGGAGKTTTALAAWDQGMDYLGDDYVLVYVGTKASVARAYATAKADARTLTLLPSLASAGAGAAPRSGRNNRWDGKVALRLAGTPGLDVVEAEVAAVVVVRVAPEPRLRAARSGIALRAATPSALFQLACDRGVAFPRLAEIVRRVPCFMLETGPEPARAAAMLRGLLLADANVAP